MNIPRTVLAPGLEISRIIKGCWQLSGRHGGENDGISPDRTSGQAAVDDFDVFAKAGVTTLDTADFYGPSETLIGRYMGFRPENVQVLTKFCCFDDKMNDADDFSFVERNIDTSRERLNVDVLDLVQFYWHDYDNKKYLNAARHLTALQRNGKIKHVGVTNFDVKHLEEIMNEDVAIVNNQVQYSLLDRRPENGMIEFCKKHDIKLLAFGVLAGGLLTDKYLGVDQKDLDINTWSKSKYSIILSNAGGWEWFQSLLRVLSTIAIKHGVKIADVASRWILDKPQVSGIILGARNASHVHELRMIFSFEMDDEDRDAIEKVLSSGKQTMTDCGNFERDGKW